MKLRIVLTLAALSLLSTKSSANEWKEFSGAIGKGSQIRMRLEVTGDSIAGTYFYLTRGETITLRGHRQSEKYSLEEYDSIGRVTAHMEFARVDDRNYIGTWQHLSRAPLPIRLSVMPSKEGVAQSDPPKFETDMLNEESKHFHYEYNIAYPQIANANDVYEWSRFNAYFAAYARNRAKWLDKEFKTRDKEMPEEGSDSYYDVGDTIVNASSQLVSVLFYFEAYWKGAAHPQHFTEAKNYSFQTGQDISLADLFTANSNYLARISRFCITDLMQQLAERINANAQDEDKEHPTSDKYLHEQLEAYREGVNSGAGPSPDNFRTFTIDTTGFTFYFDEYQVASYVDGGFQVTVPYEELKDVILPNGELRELIRR